MSKNILIISVTLLLSANMGLGVENATAAVVMIKVVHNDSLPVVGAKVTVLELNISSYTNDTGHLEIAFTIPPEWEGRDIHIITEHDHYYAPLKLIKVEREYVEDTIKMYNLFVAGYIVDSLDNDAPIEGATIRISDTTQPLIETTSDSTGKFWIESTELMCRHPAKVEIVVIKRGYAIWKGTIAMNNPRNRIRLKRILQNNQ